MKQHLNTLYVTTQGAYLAKEGQTIVVRVEREDRIQLPIHNLGGVVCFGQVSMSPWVMAHCAEHGVGVSFLSEHGRFLARVHGRVSGNVLVRREQYRRADDPVASVAIARPIVVAKLANSRAVLLRAARDGAGQAACERLTAAAGLLMRYIEEVAEEPDLERVRGLEGVGAREYFGVFGDLITQKPDTFAFSGRSRRPPLDRVNALLSFAYTLLVHDIESALEAVGLDPAVGYLHRDRPGRPGLALDLMEEFRAFLADRLVLSLINLRQIDGKMFRLAESGAVLLDDEGRKAVVTAYQKRKQEELVHAYLGERTTVGLLAHVQAQLLSRHLRGELDGYPPFFMR